MKLMNALLNIKSMTDSDIAAFSSKLNSNVITFSWGNRQVTVPGYKGTVAFEVLADYCFCLTNAKNMTPKRRLACFELALKVHTLFMIKDFLFEIRELFESCLGYFFTTNGRIFFLEDAIRSLANRRISPLLEFTPKDHECYFPGNQQFTPMEKFAAVGTRGSEFEVSKWHRVSMDLLKTSVEKTEE